MVPTKTLIKTSTNRDRLIPMPTSTLPHHQIVHSPSQRRGIGEVLVIPADLLHQSVLRVQGRVLRHRIHWSIPYLCLVNDRMIQSSSLLPIRHPQIEFILLILRIYWQRESVAENSNNRLPWKKDSLDLGQSCLLHLHLHLLPHSPGDQRELLSKYHHLRKGLEGHQRKSSLKDNPNRLLRHRRGLLVDHHQ